MTPTDTRRDPGRPGRGALYFYLSYARAAPVADKPQADRDLQVRRFYRDLHSAVRRASGRSGGADLGFYDGEVSYQADPLESMAEALGRAEILVPLYSPSYLRTSWTRREHDAYRARLRAQEVEDPAAHILPLLWTPVPADRRLEAEQADELDRAVRIGEGIAEYAAEGLRALCMLRSYVTPYERMIQRIATTIVRIAEGSPMGPAEVPDLDQIVVRPPEDESLVVTVLTTTPAEPRAAAASTLHGTAWHPYAGRPHLPVAEYVAWTAERLGLAARVTEFDDALARAVSSPVVAIVDPTILAQHDGETLLRRAFAGVMSWVRPLVVADRDDPYASEVERVLKEANSPDGSALVVTRVNGPEQLERVLPSVIVRARQAFLKDALPLQEPQPPPRPRLTGRGDQN